MYDTFCFSLYNRSMWICPACQDRGTKDILSISGRYGLPQEYNEIYDGKATEIGMLNALTAGFKLAPKTMFAINVNQMASSFTWRWLGILNTVPNTPFYYLINTYSYEIFFSSTRCDAPVRTLVRTGRG